jgi:subtilisin family serine protease
MALPFVKTVQGLGFRPSGSNDKFTETFEALPDGTLARRTNANVYNYGSSHGQVHFHEGEFLHNLGFSGQGMMIAVLDAGFNSFQTITAFDSVRMNGQILGQKDFVAFDNSVNEDDSHGMFCLSIMCANWPGRMVGTAPKANYWLVRTENASSEFPIEEHNWVVGAEFADSCGADMISSSLGYNTFDDPSFNHTYSQFYQNGTMVSKGGTLAAKKGIIVMNSAGNEGNSAWKYITFPADSDSVCAVAAMDTMKNVAPFSSYGYPGKIKPNIASVGWNTVIAGFGNDPVVGNGTSFSNPNIAGLIACLWQAFPEFNNMTILDAVYRSCPTYSTPNDRVGFGIPNMRIAYQFLLQKRADAFGSNFIKAFPVPFGTGQPLQIQLRAPESGNAALRLLDMAGRLIDKVEMNVTQDNIYDVSFRHANLLSRGIYLVQYVSATAKQTIKVIRQ